MEHKRWQEGRLSTKFIEEEFVGGFAVVPPQGELALKIAAVAAVVDHILNERKRKISGQLPAAKPVQFDRERSVVFAGEQHLLTILAAEGEKFNLRFETGKNIHLISSWSPGDLIFQGQVDGEALVVQVKPILNGFALTHAGTYTEARVFTRREAELAGLMLEKQAADTSKWLLCPMPGLVRAVFVTVGQEIKAGEPLAIVEAMKMENLLRAEKDVTIVKIHAQEGESLAVDAIIMEFA
jgi:propionyl-CoA carboxylase alpha chain